MALIGTPGLDFSVGVLVVSICSWSLLWIRQGRIKSDMQKFARANNFELLGKELPDGFVFQGTSLNDPEIANVMKGMCQGTETVVFTASFAVKDGNVVKMRIQTVVAFPNVHHLGSRQIPRTGDPNLYLEVAGEWLILYERAVVIAKEQLSGWCETMYVLAQKLTSSLNAG